MLGVLIKRSKMICLLLTLTFSMIFPIIMIYEVKGEAPTTKIYVEPIISSAAPGDSFTIKVKISGVEALYTYQVYLKWDPSILNLTGVVEGTFLNAEKTYKTQLVKKIFNRPDPHGVSGYAQIFCTLLGEPETSAAEGDGTLFSVTFLVKKEGETTIHLYETMLLDYYQKEIPHVTEDGLFQYPLAAISELKIEPYSIVDPTLTPDETITVDITIEEALELRYWCLRLNWDPKILKPLDVKEGPFMSSNGMYDTIFQYNVNSEEGYLLANCSFPADLSTVSVSGNGTLMSVTFLILSRGSTTLHLTETVLKTFEDFEVPHSTLDGAFNNLLRDIAIKSVAASPSEVKIGESVSITIVVENLGMVTESFDVSLYYDGKQLGTFVVSDLEPGKERELSFMWDTKDVKEGSYTLKVVAAEIPGEIDANNNVYSYKEVKVAPPTQELPIELILAGVAVAAVAVIIVLIILKRRK